LSVNPNKKTNIPEQLISERDETMRIAKLSARYALGIIFLNLFPAMPQAQAVAKTSNRIILAWENSPRTVDPRYAIDADSQYLADLIHCSLISFDKNGTTVPNLATKLTWVTNTTLEIDLNPNAQFSNGKNVTSSDVKATYDYFARTDLKKPSPLAGAFKKIKSITSSPSKIRIELNEPDSTFTTNLMVGILPKELVKNEVLNFGSNLVGCGPFSLNSMNVSRIILKRNENYTLSAPSKIEEIEIKIVKDETTRFAKLRKGEVDLIQNIVSRDKVMMIQKKYPNLRLQRKPGLKTTYLGFNVKDKFLQNVKVRRAISMAINRNAIIKYILNGLAIPARTMLTPGDPFLNKEIKDPVYDIAAAKKLLDSAGFKPKSGKTRFTLTYKTTQNTTRVAIAKAIAADLRKIGIQVKVQPLEWGRFKADVEAGHVQLWSLAWIGFKDPDIYRYAFATESFAPNGGNRGKYSNTEVDKLLAEGKTATDFKIRKKTYDKVQTILAAEVPYAFLWHEENFAVMNKSVKGFEVYADGRFSSLKQVSK